MWKVQLFELNFDEREGEAVKDVVDSGWITMGEKVIKFETEFSGFVGEASRSIAVSSCTAALHMALLALDLKEGDEVIIPALTFVAAINVVKIVGAKPILADCTSYDDWNVSAASIEKVLSPKTKAVMIVHFAGYPCDMDGIVKLCNEKGLPLIEDCAHAPGATYKNRSCGTFGMYGCFSFFTNKNLSVGEGGMLVVQTPEAEEKCKYLRSHGMTALTLDRHKGRAVTYDVVQSGLNYRMDEMRASLGLVQLEKLSKANMKRKALVSRYVQALKGVKGLSLPFLESKDCEPVYHIFPVLLDADIDRLKVIERLKADGVQSSIHYPAFRIFSAFKDIGLNDAPIAEDIARRELTLPLYPTMSECDQDIVIESIVKALGAE